MAQSNFVPEPVIREEDSWDTLYGEDYEDHEPYDYDRYYDQYDAFDTSFDPGDPKWLGRCDTCKRVTAPHSDDWVCRNIVQTRVCHCDGGVGGRVGTIHVIEDESERDALIAAYLLAGEEAMQP